MKTEQKDFFTRFEPIHFQNQCDFARKQLNCYVWRGSLCGVSVKYLIKTSILFYFVSSVLISTATPTQRKNWRNLNKFLKICETSGITSHFAEIRSDIYEFFLKINECLNYQQIHSNLLEFQILVKHGGF